MSASKHDKCKCGHSWIDHDLDTNECYGCSACVPKVDTVTHHFVPCECAVFDAVA